VSYPNLLDPLELTEQLSIRTRQDVALPLSTPFRGLDGQETREISIPKNTNIIVGIWASNCNPEIWGPDAYEWKPERWLEPLPNMVADAHIPGVYSNLYDLTACI